MQEEVQKDGGKSLDLINHPYIFMVRTIESLTRTLQMVFSCWIYAMLVCFKTSISVISQSTVVLQHSLHASINSRARRFVYVLLMNNLWLQNKRHAYCFLFIASPDYFIVSMDCFKSSWANTCLSTAEMEGEVFCECGHWLRINNCGVLLRLFFS